MNIIAVDDEPLALKDLVRTLRRLQPGCEPLEFATSREALEHAEADRVDVAFLDIEMPGMGGLALAKRLKDLQPDLHVVFVTSYEQYAVDAFALHATGYLLKPVQADALERELTFVYEHRTLDRHARVRIQTFGGFEAFVDGKPLAFKRSKTKELLALLVDRRGATLTAREACAALWEDKPCTASQRSYYQSLVADLRSTLAAARAGDVIVKGWNSLAIDPGAVDCDSYRFLDGDPAAVNSYRGTYLPSYSWAEFSAGALRSRLR
ncbi:response regulator [Eggerthella guodeyinii]|uniref:Response regulator n=1 Tax=Eggerthella guodeyinii TaxID=2690837 RepID=A0A6L7ITU3_9ACTN|nr:response regulator [Eggerthella guodeyinii]QOS69768.1 response regulator [Eggerthella guodeyinii]